MSKPQYFQKRQNITWKLFAWLRTISRPPVWLQNIITVKNNKQDKFLRNASGFCLHLLARRQPGMVFQLNAKPIGVEMSATFSFKRFPNRLFGRDELTPLLRRSPNITKSNVFLRGFVKTKVFWAQVSNIQELKNRIPEAFTLMTDRMLANAWRKMAKRPEMLQENGGRRRNVSV